MAIAEQRLARVEQQVDVHGADLTDMKTLLAELRADMAGLREGMARVHDSVDRLRESVDRRFEHTNQKIDRDFRSLVVLHVGTLVAIIGALAGAYYR